MDAQSDLRGRVALVTGAGEGAARAIALALARAGAAVVVSDVNPNHADAVAAEIATTGGRAFPWEADIGNKFQVGTLIERARDEFGRLHIVVCGMQVNKPAPFLTLDEYDWRRVLEVNLTGAFFVSQMAARVMTDEGGGVIVHLIGGLETPDGVEQVAYTVSRAGLAALSAAMARELSPHGVRVYAIEVNRDTAAAATEVLRAVESWR